MLETESIKLPCGYEEHFTIPVDDDLQCFICHLPLREPVLTRCGHRFCRQCLEKHLASQESQQQECSCPVDREVLGRQKDIFPDKATERKILSFAIKCSSDGCDWTGELRENENHLSSCSFKLVSCTNENCEVTIHRKELEEHVTSSCQWRIVLCDHCNESHPKCLIQDHVENKCEKKPVECPNRCGKVIVREEIASHTNNDCPLSIVSCPYVHMGCNSKIQRKKLESHLQSKIGHHLHVACTTFKETTGKLEEKVKALQRRQEKLEQEKLALQMQVQELRAGKVVLDAKMAVQEKEASELKSESSGFVWKISGFTEVLQQAMKDDNVKIYSSPFSTGPHGYKLIVGMKPLGDRTLKNRYITVFLCLVKGNYDAILAWPFHRKITFTLIDQQDDPTKRKNVVCSLLTSTSDSCCARPGPTTCVTELPGIARFVSHKNLKTNRYIVDDTLFLQVETDIPH